MVTIVFIKNPFDVDSRTIEKIECSGKSLETYIKKYKDKTQGQELYIQVNGSRTTTVNDIIFDNAFIVIHPVIAGGGDGGKNLFSVIASIALAVVSMGVGGLAAGGSWGAWGAAATAVNTAWGYAAALGVSMLGGMLISKMGPKIALGKFNSSTEPTYSWNGITTMVGQGNAVAMTYGTVKSGGQYVSQYVSQNNDNQVLNLLVCAGEGPLTITQIELNDNAIENYKEVSVDIRAGTNTQDMITNFNDTINSRNLGYELSEDNYSTDNIPGNATEGIIFDINFAQGLYHANDDGSMGTAWVDISADYALKNTDIWLPIVSGQAIIKPNGLGARLANLSAEVGTYNVCVDRNVSDDDYNNTATWYVSLKYPGERKWKHFYNFTEGETGDIYASPFIFDKQTIQAKGNGYCTSIDINKDGRISASQTSAVRRQFRIDNIPAGEYKVRAKIIARSASVKSTRDGVKCWWPTISSIVYDDFVYPNKALIGIKALATNQLSGSSPNLTFIKNRKTVLVFNPLLNDYEDKPATNPAWASYDFCHGARKLKDIHNNIDVIDVRGVPAKFMMFERFNEWANYCDKMRLEINIEIATVGEFWTIINQDIAPVGRGKVVQFGTRFGCIWQCVSQPVQMFTMGNIIAGTFQQSWLGTKDRANAIEITFNNKDKNYSRDTVTCFGSHYDEQGAIANATQIAMNGITSYEQCYREAKYQLKCNEQLLQSVNFKAEIDAIGCTVGDQILVAHDVPQWSFSGRISKCNGLISVTVPLYESDVDLNAKYQFQYRSRKDVIHVRNVENIVLQIDVVTITVTVPFDVDDCPQEDDIYSLGPIDKTCKPFIVTSITRGSDYQRNITALEYNAAVFEEDYNIPMPDYTTNKELEAVNVINLEANQIAYNNNQGIMLCKMFCSWQLPVGANANYFSVLLSDNNGETWKLASTELSQEVEIDTKPFTSYLVKVVTHYQLRQSDGAIFGPVSAGIDEVPPNVTVLDHELVADGTRRFWWEFKYPNPNDIAGFKIKYIQGNYINWESAYELYSGLISMQPFETQALRQGTHTVMIKAVDNAGQESKDFAYTVINLGDPLEDNVLYQKDLSANGWSSVVTNGLIASNNNIVSKQNSYFWSSNKSIFWTKTNAKFWREKYTAFYLQAQEIIPASGQFWLKYAIDGCSNLEYRVVGTNYFWKNADCSFWANPQSGMWVNSTTLFKPYTGKIQVRAGDIVQMRVLAPENATQATMIKSLIMFVDVPDREEHFNNLEVPIAGLKLNVLTPNFHTTSVRIDSIRNYENTVRLAVVNKNPCIIKLLDINNNPVTGIVDVTWQGFIKEMIKCQ